MIGKLLIANRGEIACRVIRTAKKLNIATVAVYSEADRHAQHVKQADDAVCLGPAPASQSYLKGDLIIKFAKQLKVDAIHPGYGFLSENANFAEKCAENGIIFIGPNSDAIRAMGSKSAAKAIMEEAKVPLVPGYHGSEQSAEFLQQKALEIGYPVLLKAAAGGGGKGMRQVDTERDFMDALKAAKREAKASFDDDLMLVEKYLTQPRHVEIQVFCDNHSNGVYLFERDCSVQRRHQKIIEEAPAPGLSTELRKEMGEAALKAAFAINYTGAGTVEFLLDSDGSFYFMEMNTRLQVEHPVTEFVTGEDLVEWQIMVANNQRLPKQQSQLTLNGHAFEARIYAEDPNNEFLPSTGLLNAIVEPSINENVRVDTGVISGDEVSIYYDPMIAKLIVHGPTREQALELLLKSLRQYMVCGVTTNIDYLIKVTQSEPFKNAELTTDFIERHAKVLESDILSDTLEPQSLMAISAAFSLLSTTYAKQSSYSNFRLNHLKTENIKFEVNQQVVELKQAYLKDGSFKLYLPSNTISYSAKLQDSTLQVTTENFTKTYRVFETDNHLYLQLDFGTLKVTKIFPDLGVAGDDAHANEIFAPMNGTIVDVLVHEGQSVEKGQVLVIVEAMKMEHSLKAPYSATISECFVQKGDLVDGSKVLISLQMPEQDNS